MVAQLRSCAEPARHKQAPEKMVEPEVHDEQCTARNNNDGWKRVKLGWFPPAVPACLAARDYKLGTKLGLGSYSRVYSIRKEGGPKLAVKMVSKDTDDPVIVSEVTILARLSHRNIVSFVDFLEDDRAYYLVMERCHRGTLGDLLRRHKRLPEVEAKLIIRDVAGALAYLHGQCNVMHRDVKPDNILLTTDGQNGRLVAKLADFGFAHQLSNGETEDTEIAGTPLYMAPEMHAGAHGLASDVWSLGVVAFRVLGGKHPFLQSGSGRSSVAPPPRATRATGNDGRGAAEEQRQGWSRLLKPLERRVSSGDYSFQGAAWERVSLAAKLLVTRMLLPDPQKRITPREVLAHPWFTADRPAAAAAAAEHAAASFGGPVADGEEEGEEEEGGEVENSEHTLGWRWLRAASWATGGGGSSEAGATAAVLLLGSGHNPLCGGSRLMHSPPTAARARAPDRPPPRSGKAGGGRGKGGGSPRRRGLLSGLLHAQSVRF